MPEGHTVHRTADSFNRLFAGRELTVDSPQGRFATDAELVSGTEFLTAWAIGKQLFLDFAGGLTVRIHLGIYGKWAWIEGDTKTYISKPVTGQVRARFYGADALAELRGPTVCEVIGAGEVDSIRKRLGPDPLNPDPTGAERLRFIERVTKSGTPVGQLLMDQAVIAGVGNVYRAELLFRAGQSPFTPGRAVPADVIGAIWDDAVRLLEVGVAQGVMITRDEHLNEDPGKPERNFVYKREGEPCRVCGTKISLAPMAGRKLYWCPSCQKP